MEQLKDFNKKRPLRDLWEEITWKYGCVIHFFKDIRSFFRNLWFWRRTLWEDRWWDYTYIFCLLGRKFQQMEEGFLHKGVSKDAEREARKIRICRLLCERISEADYEPPDWMWKVKDYRYFEWKDARMKDDIEYLSQRINKYVRGWWD